MKIYNSTQNNLIADEVKVAKTFIKKTFGLILRNDISEADGLIIKPCNSIHTFFMRFPIDVLFVDRKNKIIALHENVKPWRILPIHFNSSYVIEIKSGQISAKTISRHDIIQIDE